MSTYDVGAIRAYLLTQADLTALVGARIYGHEIPDTESNAMPRKVVLINDAGNSNQDESFRPLNWQLKDFRCYGESAYEAARVFDVVAQILKNLERTSVNVSGLDSLFLYSAIKVAGRFTSREPDTDWPVSFGTFNLMMGES